LKVATFTKSLSVVHLLCHMAPSCDEGFDIHCTIALQGLRIDPRRLMSKFLHVLNVSPLGRALMKSAAGDSVVLQLPGGTEYLTVLEVCYERISVEPFREPPGSEASAKGLPRRR